MIRMNGTFLATKTRSTLLELEPIGQRKPDSGKLQEEIRLFTQGTPSLA